MCNQCDHDANELLAIVKQSGSSNRNVNFLAFRVISPYDIAHMNDISL